MHSGTWLSHSYDRTAAQRFTLEEVRHVYRHYKVSEEVIEEVLASEMPRIRKLMQRYPTITRDNVNEVIVKLDRIASEYLVRELRRLQLARSHSS